MEINAPETKKKTKTPPPPTENDVEVCILASGSDLSSSLVFPLLSVTQWGLYSRDARWHRVQHNL